MRLIRHITPLGRVLISLTIATAVAVVVLHDVVTYVIGIAVCACWIKVYTATDPLCRAGRGDDPAKDSVSWRDREL